MQPVLGMLKTLVSLAALSALTFTAHRASADDAFSTPRDRATAFGLSAGGTAASIGLVLVGVKTGSGALAGAGVLGTLIAPSAGELYAGQLFTAGMGLRVVSGAVALAGAARIVACAFDDGSLDQPGYHSACPADQGLTGALLIGGAIGYAGGILYDIATAGRAVDDYNQQLHLRVAPTVIQTASSGPAVGLGIGGSF